MASAHGPLGGVPNKLTKARIKVKPILKKLAHSEKNSLDLDRGWEEQPRQAWADSWDAGSSGRSAREFSVSFGLGGDGGGRGESGIGGISGLGGGGSGGGGGGGGGVGVIRKPQHTRSASGTSHISVATNGSGPRGGTFVHPFQQTPRTSTPPLSYANSMASFDMPRDYSPTITENDDGLESQSFSPFTGPPSLSHHLQHHNRSSTFSQPGLRRPSFASQRTSSLTDISSAAPQLRVNTGRSTTSSSRLAHGTLVTSSHSDLHLKHLNHALRKLESPTGSLNGPAAENNSTTNINGNHAAAAAGSTSQLASPTSPLSSEMSPFDSSAFPRLRSRSEVDTASRAEQIREARRKFDERERAKEEKYDREQIRKRERHDAKEAIRMEKEAAQLMKKLAPMGVSGGGGSGSGGRGSQASVRTGPGSIAGVARNSGEIAVPRPSASRKSTATSLNLAMSPGGGGSGTARIGGTLTAGSSRHDVSSASGFGLGSMAITASPISGIVPGRASRKNSGCAGSGGGGGGGGADGGGKNCANTTDPEKKMDFWANNYDTFTGVTTPEFGPSIDGVQFTQAQPRRVRTAKKKTQGYWHGFVFWLRTKLLRMGAK